jgi:hypothetical protein
MKRRTDQKELNRRKEWGFADRFTNSKTSYTTNKRCARLTRDRLNRHKEEPGDGSKSAVLY